ncbi:unnamed protein product, partial [marine sediment metagenome]
ALLNFWEPGNGRDRVFHLREDGVYEQIDTPDVKISNSIRKDIGYFQTDGGDHYEPVNLRKELRKIAKDL